MTYSKKKALLLFSSTTAMVSAPAVVVACSSGAESIKPFDFTEVQKEINSNGYQFQAADWSFKTVDWNTVSYVDARIDYWIDGDTPKIHLDKDYAGFSSSDSVSLRVVGIDTPELHVAGADGKINVKTTGLEEIYADKGRVFGDTEMPKGTHIRIATSGDKSFNRLSGGIFYGKDFEKNYSTEILKKGLAYPFISDSFAIMNDDNIMHYILLPIADAFNRAYNSHIGIFSEPVGTVSKIHGPTDTSTVQWDKHDLLTGNIYKTISKMGSEL